ncbi:gliding motility protein GldN [Bernardetia sp.]|uniref:type IX secretion system ring protein PorN/GldN n=1 Tax=Bernardetia sp. TaxID=1937974 RepID=UPI0025C61DA3|nr:gliding motility protein GldN [Bernardetia sp.]
MKKLILKSFTSLLALLLVSASNFSLGQSALSPNEKNIESSSPSSPPTIQDPFNPFSLRPIPKSHIAFQKTLWLRLSFKQKTNLPLWYAGHQLSKFLIENALEGKITAYQDDKLETVLSKSELLEKLKAENQENALQNDCTTRFINFSELSTLEIKEDYILDNRHSRMIHDVLAFTLILPHNAEGNSLGLTQKIVSFSYKEIIEKLFRPLKEDYVVIETTKSNGHIPNLETLIDARFFHGYVVKYDNFGDEYFEDKYDNKREAALKCIQYEEHLIEFEGTLWEY